MGKSIQKNNELDRKTMALWFSGYKFDDLRTNYALVEFCGVSPWSIFWCQKLAEVSSPKKDSNENSSSSTNEETEEKGAESTVHVDHSPLLFGKVVYRNENNVIYGAGGVGKSQLLAEIARNDTIKHPFLIVREDYNDSQAERYRHHIGKKATIISLGAWQEKEKELRDSQQQKALCEITLRCLEPKFHKFQNITDQVYSRLGLDSGKKFDEIDVLNAIVQEAIEQGADFIGLDSFNSLLGRGSRIDRKTIERIVAPLRGKPITLVMVHHKNAKGEMYGGVTIRDAVDHVYELRSAPVGRVTEDTDTLILEEVKARDTKKQTLVFTRTFIGDEVRYEVLSDDPSNSSNTRETEARLNLAGRTKRALSSFAQTDVTYDALRETLCQTETVSHGGLKAVLKTLREQGIISMADGSTWAMIHRNVNS